MYPLASREGIDYFCPAMLESILRWDFHLFQLINQIWTNPFLDAVLPFMRNQYVWAPFYVFIIAFLAFNYGKKGWLFVVLAVCTVIVSNLVSSEWIKKNIRRTRPCNEIRLAEQRRILVHCGVGYSFTSSHAANHFSFASFICFAGAGFFRRYRWLFMIWAAVISYAQVYVGVHYPLDIIIGGLLGFWIGLAGVYLYRKLAQIV
jgi:membrane-associated phospholipid phosphatase